MERDDAKDRSLARIAPCLGIPVASFSDDKLPDRLRLLGECVRLWNSLPADDARRRALDALRSIAAEQAA